MISRSLKISIQKCKLFRSSHSYFRFANAQDIKIDGNETISAFNIVALENVFTVAKAIKDCDMNMKVGLFTTGKEWPLIGDLIMRGIITECNESYLMNAKDLKKNTIMSIILPAFYKDII
jgi:hypothetical protein